MRALSSMIVRVPSGSASNVPVWALTLSIKTRTAAALPPALAAATAGLTMSFRSSPKAFNSKGSVNIVPIEGSYTNMLLTSSGFWTANGSKVPPLNDQPIRCT